MALLLLMSLAGGSADPQQNSLVWTGPPARVVRTAGGFPALTIGAGPPAPTFWLNIVNNVNFGGEAAVAEEIIRAKQAGLNVLSICLSTAWVDGMPDWLNFSAVNGSAGTRSTFDLIAKHHPTAALIVRWDITSFEREWWMQVHDAISTHSNSSLVDILQLHS